VLGQNLGDWNDAGDRKNRDEEPSSGAGIPKSPGKPKQKQKPHQNPGTADTQDEEENPDEEDSPEDQEDGEDDGGGGIERWDNGPFGSKGMRMRLKKRPPMEPEKTEGDGTQGERQGDENEKNLPQSVQARQAK